MFNPERTNWQRVFISCRKRNQRNGEISRKIEKNIFTGKVSREDEENELKVDEELP